MGVDVHCRADVRVTQKLLLDLQIYSQGAQQGRVPEGVPAHAVDADLLERRLNLFPTKFSFS